MTHKGRVWVSIALAWTTMLGWSDLVRADAPRTPGPAAAALTTAPTGYRIVNATEFGKALSSQKPNASSVRAALTETLRDLARSFGTLPTVRTAYEDVKDHRSGGAVFVGSDRGQPVKGLVLCRLGTAGASVAAIYARPDTPPAQWRRLTSAPATASSPADATSAVPGATGPQASGRGTVTPLPTPAHASLREYQMPDGTGSVGLAEGWHTSTQSLMEGVVLQGPADQRVMIMMSAAVHTPGSQFANTMGRSGVPGLVAPFSTPLEAVAVLAPQMSQMSQRRGGPSFEIDSLVQVAGAQSWGPNDRAAFLEYSVTETGSAGRRHYRALALVHMSPLAAGSETWMYHVTTMRAPDATFDRDLPLMLQLAGSERENAQAIMSRAHQNVTASERRTQEVLAQTQQRSIAFEAQRAEFARTQNAFMRTNDDFDEAIRGTRTVEDTTTGQRISVDLGDVDRITDRMNEVEAGRYRQIPLRDEVDPVH